MPRVISRGAGLVPAAAFFAAGYFLADTAVKSQDNRIREAGGKHLEYDPDESTLITQGVVLIGLGMATALATAFRLGQAFGSKPNGAD